MSSIRMQFLAAFLVIFSQYSSFLLLSSAQYITKPIISICTGAVQTCAVFNNNKVKCWGRVFSWGVTDTYIDRLGDSMADMGDNLPYLDVGTGASVEQVICGLQHICIRLSTKQMKCLGLNQKGQIGVGVSTTPIGIYSGHIGDNLPAVSLGTGLDVLAIEASYYSSCSKLTGNKVKCFGDNQYGQLGLGDTTDRGQLSSQMGNNLPFIDFGTNVEVDVIRGSGVGNHMCAILSAPPASAQRIKCWGRGTFYALGYGDASNRGDATNEMGDSLPLIDLGTVSTVKQIITGGDHTCAVLTNDVLKCWGRAVDSSFPSGQIASVTLPSSATATMLLDAGRTVKLISGGSQRTCIVYDDYITMKCCGLAYLGQIGSGDSIERGDTPDTRFPYLTAVPLGTASLQISIITSGDAHNCVVYVDNSIKCFGYNIHGELGIGSTNEEVGDGPNEMGSLLPFVMLFSPTQSPALPTRSPTLKPTVNPTITMPTFSPTLAPTKVSNNPAPIGPGQDLIIALAVLVPLICVCSVLGYVVAKRNNGNSQKRYLAYISHGFQETGQEVEALSKELNKRKQRSENILVVDKDRQSVKMTSKTIKQSRAVVFVLSEKFIKSSSFFIDLSFAYEHKVDIVLIEIVGTRTTKDTLISYLEGLTDAEYKRVDPKGSVRLANQKISIESHKKELVEMLIGFVPCPFKIDELLGIQTQQVDEIWRRIRQIAPPASSSIFDIFFNRKENTKFDIELSDINRSSQLQAETTHDKSPVLAQEIDEATITNQRNDT